MNRIKREVKSKLKAVNANHHAATVNSHASWLMKARGNTKDLFVAPITLSCAPLSVGDKLERGLQEYKHERLIAITRSARQVATVLRAVRNNTLRHSYMLTSLIGAAMRLNVKPAGTPTAEQTLQALLKHHLREFRSVLAHSAAGPRNLPA